MPTSFSIATDHFPCCYSTALGLAVVSIRLKKDSSADAACLIHSFQQPTLVVDVQPVIIFTLAAATVVQDNKNVCNTTVYCKDMTSASGV
jgi:hypothetical protein